MHRGEEDSWKGSTQILGGWGLPHLSAKRTGRKPLYLIVSYKTWGTPFFTSSELLLRGPPAKTASRRPTMRNDLGAQRQANPQTPHKRSSLRDSQKRRAGRAHPKEEIDPPFCQFWRGAEMHRGEEDSWKGSTPLWNRNLQERIKKRRKKIRSWGCGGLPPPLREADRA